MDRNAGVIFCMKDACHILISVTLIVSTLLDMLFMPSLYATRTRDDILLTSLNADSRASSVLPLPAGFACSRTLLCDYPRQTYRRYHLISRLPVICLMPIWRLTILPFATITTPAAASTYAVTTIVIGISTTT